MVADKGSPWAYSGYQMTCYSNTEEMTNELLFGSKLQFKVGSQNLVHLTSYYSNEAGLAQVETLFFG